MHAGPLGTYSGGLWDSGPAPTSGASYQQILGDRKGGREKGGGRRNTGRKERRKDRNSISLWGEERNPPHLPNAALSNFLIKVPFIFILSALTACGSTRVREQQQ